MSAPNVASMPALEPYLAAAVNGAVPCYVSTCRVLQPGADRGTKICPDRPARWLAWYHGGRPPKPLCWPCRQRWTRYGNVLRAEAL